MSRIHWTPSGMGPACSARGRIQGEARDRLAVTCRRCLRALGAPEDATLLDGLDGLTVRTQNGCSRLGLLTVGDVRARSDRELLLRNHYIGRKQLAELRAVCAGMAAPKPPPARVAAPWGPRDERAAIVRWLRAEAQRAERSEEAGDHGGFMLGVAGGLECAIEAIENGAHLVDRTPPEVTDADRERARLLEGT